MSLSNCTKCGEMIMNRPDELCAACSQQMLEEAQRVKAYVRLHPNATVMEVYHQTGVSLQTIKTFMGDQ